MRESPIFLTSPTCGEERKVRRDGGMVGEKRGREGRREGGKKPMDRWRKEWREGKKVE